MRDVGRRPGPVIVIFQAAYSFRSLRKTLPHLGHWAWPQSQLLPQ